MALGRHRLMSLVVAAVLLLAASTFAAPQDKAKRKQLAVAPEPSCWAGEQLLNVDSLRNAYTRHKMPMLPPELTKEATRLSIVLKLCIDAKGRVGRVFVLSSSGSAAVDAFYETAATKWTFKPAQKDGKPIPSFTRMSVNWNIE